MALCQLIYLSKRGNLGAGGVQEILDHSREANTAADLTGVLLFDQQYFVQLLEGSRENVTTSFRRIAEDPRHDNVELVSVQDVEKRDFPNWTMGYVPTTSPAVNDALREYSPSGVFSPGLLSAPSIIALMKRMASVERLV